jgi:pseudaminic acid cytidylyltransferase
MTWAGGGILDKARNIAVIPARGGSKRLKKKNILPFNGKPMIHYSIEAALDSNLFEKVVVSSEDKDIIDCVKCTGCEIALRKPELATDTARVVDVLNDLLQGFAQRGEQYDYLCCLYATSPLRTFKDISGAFHLMTEKGADFCQSVTDYETSPFFAFDMDENSVIKRRWPDFALLPPRKKPLVVVDNGSIYWAKVPAFLGTCELHGEHTLGYKMPRSRSVDIDTLTDFKLAEFYLKEMENA